MRKKNKPARRLFVCRSYYVRTTLFPLAVAAASQSSGGDDDFMDFGDFYDEFDKMDQEDRVHDNLGKGLENWETRCEKIGGKDVLDDWLKAQEDLVYCVLENFDADKIHNEMEAKKKTGDLDLVFKDYCAYVY